MMLKAQAVAGQAKAIAGPVRLGVVATRKHTAFKGSRAVVVHAAEGDAPEAAPEAVVAKAAPRSTRAPRREVTVQLDAVKAGDEFEGAITAVEGYGAFVDFGAETDGLVHISQLSNKFVKSISETVSVGDLVKVRVLSVDAATKKIALSMKTEDAALDSAGGGGGSDFAEEEEDGPTDLLPADGHEFVYADAVAEFEFPFQMEEDVDISLNAVNDFEDSELVVDAGLDLPLPLNELVSGMITRVEEYGAFMTVAADGKELKAFLACDEAKLPTAALSPEELKEYVEKGEAVPTYVSGEFDDMKQYYKVGDMVSAFVLDYTDRGEINLTQYTDAEVEADGFELDDDEDFGDKSFGDKDRTPSGPRDDEPLSMLGGAVGFDILALDPEDLMDDDDVDGVSTTEAGDLSDAVGDYKVYGRSGPLSGVLFTTRGRGLAMPSVAFPDRPLDKLDGNAINNLATTDLDFDGDEIYLEELWQESIPVPKSALTKLGLKCEWSEDGALTLVEREDAEVIEDDAIVSLSGDLDARVAAFVADLLDEDDGEAEIPAYAMRRPVVMAIAVSEISAKTVKALRDKTGAGMMDCKKALAECDADEDKATEWLRQKGLSGADKKSGRVASEGAIVQYIHPGARLGVLLEVNCETDFVAAGDKFQSIVNEIGMIIAASPDVKVVNVEDVSAEMLAKEREVQMGLEELKTKPEAIRSKIVEGRLDKIKNSMALVNQDSLRDSTKTVGEIVKETIAATGEKISIRRFVKFQLGEGIEKKSSDFAAEVAEQTAKKAAAPETPKKEEPKKAEEVAAPTVAVSASTVKELRQSTGAGMMDCKKALAQNDNDIEKATEWLRKKGLAGADKKSGRIAAEGALVAYIHPGSRLGVLLEVNCETDFVAAGDPFNKLINGIAMQIAASPTVQYVSAEDIPASVFEREKLIEMGREDLQSKPEAIRAKIAEGRVAKMAQEMALLPQPYLMDNTKTVEQAVKEAIASIGEKISIRRFVKFHLGEGIEKKTMDLAADVAAMTKSA
ncbi:hypothetical protein FOA52_002256 [Chlamydomonas sp. UWO 241]|nr:hypothetical protein FOA52_002256 [Chlamydomonas sp. UWO 241]